MDGNGNLDMSELKDIMKNPQFVSTAMEHLDLNLDGCVSLREWLISMKLTCDKSEAACKTALKMHEKGDARHQPEPARRPNSSAAFLWPSLPLRRRAALMPLIASRALGVRYMYSHYCGQGEEGAGARLSTRRVATC